MEHVPKEDLVHGFYYKGECRNADVARWNNDIKKFIYWRSKFGDTFLEEICCPEDDEEFDVFYAQEIIQPKDVEQEISFERYRNGD